MRRNYLLNRKNNYETPPSSQDSPPRYSLQPLLKHKTPPPGSINIPFVAPPANWFQPELDSLRIQGNRLFPPLSWGLSRQELLNAAAERESYESNDTKRKILKKGTLTSKKKGQLGRGKSRKSTKRATIKHRKSYRKHNRTVKRRKSRRHH